MVRTLLAVMVAVLACPVFLSARDAREQQRIDYLIESLGSLKGAVFIRNGTEYDAAKARAHLRAKLDYVGERVKTAEQFIQYCASQSSMSHQPYQIRFSDGRTVGTADYFGGKLKEFDEKKAPK
jgi:hypothetical protein